MIYQDKNLLNLSARALLVYPLIEKSRMLPFCFPLPNKSTLQQV